MSLIGKQLPDATIRLITGEGPEVIQSSAFAKGKTLVLVGVPGAFTPTCHKNHVPGFLNNIEKIKAKGVDEVAIITLNDHHVVKEWAKASDPDKKLTFLADGNGDFTKALDLGFDAAMGGMGFRMKRFSMIIKDGVVTALNVEPAPGQADVSGAESLLAQL